MKNKYIKIGLLALVATASSQVSAQVKVGDNLGNVNENAALEIESIDKGLILPRVALESTSSFNPMSAHVVGMKVYNTATAGDVTPGEYYNDGTQWIRVATGADAKNLPWFVQNTLNEATANTEDIYQQGKVAVGFTDIDAVSGKQFEVKGDFKTEANVGGRNVGFDTNLEGSGIGLWYNADDIDNPTDVGMIQLHQNSVHLVAQSPTNIGATQIAPGLVEYRAGNWGLTDGVSIHHMDKDQIFLSSGSSSAGGNDDNTRLYVRKGQGVLFAHTDDNGDREGEYTFPRNAGQVGQVLAVETNVSDVSTLEWKDVSDLVKAAMPKFFYMPSVEIPTHNTSTGTLLTGTQTIDLYASYTEQFGFTGGVGQARSNTSSIIPTLPANELDYFITYFDTDVFENVSVSALGVLTYSVKSEAIVTPKTFMNIVFKVRD